MNKFRNTLAALSIALVPLVAGAGSASAQTFNNGGSGCSVVELGVKNGGSFTVQGNNATTTVQVKGPANCKETVSLASWNTALGSNSFRPLETQRFVTGKTYTNLGVGKHTLNIYVNSSCNFQLDISLGSHQKSVAHNDANYGPELMGYSQVFSGVCPVPTPTPTPVPTPTPTPTPTPVPTPTPTPTPTPVPTPTPAAPAPTVTAQPAQLVNTGPGNVIGIVAAFSVAGAFLHRAFLRRSMKA